MPKVIDIRDNDSTALEEIIVSDELKVKGFHQQHYNCFELLQDDNEEISLTFDQIDDLIKALRMVKQIREDMQG